MIEKECNIKETYKMLLVMWMILGICLTVPVFLLSYLVGYGNFDNLHILAIIGLGYVIFDIGKTVIISPPSKMYKVKL
jgi:hypothetical protein